MSAVQKIDPPSLPAERVTVTPMDMLAQAVERGMAVETIDKLMMLADRWHGNQARMAFDAAVAAAKAEIPVIIKNRDGHNNKRYADLAAIAATVDPILGRHGLGYRFRTVQDDKLIRVTCILFHKDGHAEETTLAGPSDTSGNKNAIQSIGSTLTYLQRYSLVQSLGLAAAEDDDGHTDGPAGAITPEQVQALQSAIVEVAADIQKFCRYFKVERIEELPATRYADAMRALNAKRNAP